MTLQKKYPIKMNWKKDYYLRIALEWDYNKIHSERNIQLSMPGYVKEALIEFKHHFIKQQLSTSPFQDPIYGQKVQYIEIIDIQRSQKIKSIYYKEYVENSYTMFKLSVVQ